MDDIVPDSGSDTDIEDVTPVGEVASSQPPSESEASISGAASDGRYTTLHNRHFLHLAWIQILGC